MGNKIEAEKNSLPTKKIGHIYTDSLLNIMVPFKKDLRINAPETIPYY
jgi:hypothetical protein